MSQIDLGNKSLYAMVDDQNMMDQISMDNVNMELPNAVTSPVMVEAPVRVEASVMVESPVTTPVAVPVYVPVPAKPVEEHKKKPMKLQRSVSGFIIFSLVVLLLAAFIYFTIYRLGWGVKECMNKNYHDCAALLTPELAPLAAAGILAVI